MKYNKLFEGVNVSVLSVGGSPFGGVFGPIAENDVAETINRALELGINYFDTAPMYGVTKSETNMGKVFKNIPREKYFMCSKTGRFDEDKFDFSAERVTKSVEESLARLNVDYLDLILCHDVEYVHLDQVINEAIPALVKLKAAGKVKAIGFSCYPLKPYVEIIKRVPPNTIDAVLVYAHYTLFDTTLNSLISFFQEHNVKVINASPLGMGLLTEGGPPAWNPSDAFVKETCAKAAAHCRSKGQNIAKLAVQFSARTNPNIVTTIVGVANVQQLEENVKWLEEEIDEVLLKEVLEILAPIKDHKRMTGLPENN
eukprot:Phypoly_transcript_05965.p1 GENE.Phypoly_transcript_05965~~Phypoly_transcript_05965.p1  ORF type:complete len:313 (-),score=53.98 Phypoly_transcript_05965:133-1071(-)